MQPHGYAYGAPTPPMYQAPPHHVYMAAATGLGAGVPVQALVYPHQQQQHQQQLFQQAPVYACGGVPGFQPPYGADVTYAAGPFMHQAAMHPLQQQQGPAYGNGLQPFPAPPGGPSSQYTVPYMQFSHAPQQPPSYYAPTGVPAAAAVPLPTSQPVRASSGSDFLFDSLFAAQKASSIPPHPHQPAAASTAAFTSAASAPLQQLPPLPPATAAAAGISGYPGAPAAGAAAAGALNLPVGASSLAGGVHLAPGEGEPTSSAVLQKRIAALALSEEDASGPADSAGGPHVEAHHSAAIAPPASSPTADGTLTSTSSSVAAPAAAAAAAQQPAVRTGPTPTLEAPGSTADSRFAAAGSVPSTAGRPKRLPPGFEAPTAIAPTAAAPVTPAVPSSGTGGPEAVAANGGGGDSTSSNSAVTKKAPGAPDGAASLPTADGAEAAKETAAPASASASAAAAAAESLAELRSERERLALRLVSEGLPPSALDPRTTAAPAPPPGSGSFSQSQAPAGNGGAGGGGAAPSGLKPAGEAHSRAGQTGNRPPYFPPPLTLATLSNAVIDQESPGCGFVDRSTAWETVLGMANQVNSRVMALLRRWLDHLGQQVEAEERFSRFFESWFAHVVAQRGMGGAEVGSLVADAEAVVDAYRSKELSLARLHALFADVCSHDREVFERSTRLWLACRDNIDALTARLAQQKQKQ